MKKQQSGFTMIELIMVIVILGILAAFAIPKFVNLGSDARKSTVQGAYGSIKSAAALTHASWLAKNNPAAESVTVEGGTVAMVANAGYPTAAAIAGAAGITTEASGDFVEVSAGVFAAKGVSSANQATCAVTYVAPNPSPADPEDATTVPAITINVDNCD